MSADRPQFNEIKGDESLLRLPRLGKIHLGIKMGVGTSSEHPKETDYFVCPPGLESIIGVKPKEIDIVFPVESQSVIFSRAYKYYAGPTLRCKGNGVTALRMAGYLGDQAKTVTGPIPADKNAMVEIPCPCPLLTQKNAKGRFDCAAVGMLSFMIPQVSIAGVFQIDVKGISSTKNILAGLAMARSWMGRVSMIPFKLKRVPEHGTYQGKATTHYVLRLEHQISYEQIRKLKGDNFLLGMDPAIEGEDQTVQIPVEYPEDVPEAPPPPGVVVEEDVDPELLNASQIYIFVQKTTQKGEGYIIEGQEDTVKASPVLSFFTQNLEHVKLAWELAKGSLSADIHYKTHPDGSFEIVAISEGIPF